MCIEVRIVGVGLLWTERRLTCMCSAVPRCFPHRDNGTVYAVKIVRKSSLKARDLAALYREVRVMQTVTKTSAHT